MARELRGRSAAALTGIIGAVAIVVVAMLAQGSAQSQGNIPYDKERLLKVVRLNALSTKEIVQAIQRRGVSFQMTPDVEAEFNAVNAPPSVIEALRANYRPASAPAATSTTSSPGRSTGRPPSNVPTGPPLGKNEIITLLQSGASAARVEQFVEARGVDFQLTSEITREIMAAGGTRSLVGAISEKSTAGSQSSGSSPGSYSGIGASMEDRVIGGQTYIFITATAPSSPAARAGLLRGDRLVEIDGRPVAGQSIDAIVNLVRGPSGSTVNLTVERAATRRIETLRITREITSTGVLPTTGSNTRSNGGPNYDELTDQATALIATAITASDVTSGNYALNLLQQALRLDPSRPTAYQLLGVQDSDLAPLVAQEPAEIAAFARESKCDRDHCAIRSGWTGENDLQANGVVRRRRRGVAAERSGGAAPSEVSISRNAGSPDTGTMTSTLKPLSLGKLRFRNRLWSRRR